MFGAGLLVLELLRGLLRLHELLMHALLVGSACSLPRFGRLHLSLERLLILLGRRQLLRRCSQGVSSLRQLGHELAAIRLQLTAL